MLLASRNAEQIDLNIVSPPWIWRPLEIHQDGVGGAGGGGEGGRWAAATLGESQFSEFAGLTINLYKNESYDKGFYLFICFFEISRSLMDVSASVKAIKQV